MTEYGHNFWSRNRCWAYNIPNRSTHQALQIWQVETQQPNFLGRNSLVFISFGEKNRRTVTEYGDNFWSRNRCGANNIPNRSTLQPLQIWQGETNQPNFLGRNSLVFISFEEKNWRTVTEYSHKFWSRNRCWAYNIPNRSTLQALQIWRGETHQPKFLGRNSLVFVSFGGKKIGELWLNTAITFDPEIVAGPIIYQIEALIKLYKFVGAKPNNPIF